MIKKLIISAAVLTVLIHAKESGADHAVPPVAIEGVALR